MRSPSTDPLGTGVRLPLIDGFGFHWIEGESAVAQSLRALLLTEPGERVGRPDFGVGLRRFLFAQNTIETRTRIRQAVREAVEAQEHRVALDEVLVDSEPAAPTRLRIDLQYRLKDGPDARNLVATFDLATGVLGP